MKSALQQNFLMQQLGHCTRLAHATVRPHYAKHMLALDLKPSEFAVLSLISANPGASQRQIAETVMISQPNMAALMERLQVRGLLRREADPADRRLSLLYLTAEGERLHEKAAAQVEILEQEASRMLSAEDKQQLLRLLHKMVDCAG
ncbi:MAG: Transcriptional regulator HosA [Delftia tsuruhatensis]|nr:MAG: Transcriptional regulator HosA [Delftia tsuruhatensis]